MKCQACGYQYKHKVKYYKEAIFFKSGKRKGEFKCTETNKIELEIGTEDFKLLTITGGLEFIDSTSSSDKEIDVYMCPECGTLKTDEGWK